MKIIMTMLMLAIAPVVQANSCKDSVFKYQDQVKIVDKNSFYYGCKGLVVSSYGFFAGDDNKTVCSYSVDDLCGDSFAEFSADQLKLIKKGKR